MHTVVCNTWLDGEQNHKHYVDKGQEIGLIKPVKLVEDNDPLWNDTEEDTSVQVWQVRD